MAQSDATMRRAFVIMPIGSEGTESHAYFSALYSEYIKPTLERAGYVVARADDSQLGGAVTKELVLQLAEADVVVADLTTVNPNVFYEVGVRHSLRRSGTVLLLDEERTPSIPFDLSGYRAVLFRSDLAGVAAMQHRLTDALRELESSTPDHRDNPVHDWLPMLPSNSVAASTGTEVGVLREELAEANRRLRDYEKAYGEGPRMPRDDELLGSVISKAQADAREGNLLPDLLRAAEQAVFGGNREGFLSVLRKVFDRGHTPDPDQYLRLALHARQLDLIDVATAIYDQAVKLYPTSDEVRRQRLAHLTQSVDGSDRELARTEIRAEVGIAVTDSDVMVPDLLTEDAIDLLAVMLDAYHADGLNDEALTVTTALAARFGDRSAVARNHARALERANSWGEAVTWYIAACKCADVTDLTPSFFGAALHNRQQHVDALEAYALAATLDVNDATNLARIASEASIALEKQITGGDKSSRPLPPEVTLDVVKDAIHAALSCDLVSDEVLDRCVKAAQRAELSPDLIQDLLGSRDGAPGILGARLGMKERYVFSNLVYEALRTELTASVSQ